MHQRTEDFSSTSEILWLVGVRRVVFFHSTALTKLERQSETKLVVDTFTEVSWKQPFVQPDFYNLYGKNNLTRQENNNQIYS